MAARGIRNNNPLNIRRGCKWKGLVDNPTDKEFCQFRSMAYGLRAALILIRNYMTGRCADKKCRRSIYDIISKWAPSSENNTSAYMKSVAMSTGLDIYQTFEWHQRGVVVAVVWAMAKVECGFELEKAIIFSAYDLVVSETR